MYTVLTLLLIAASALWYASKAKRNQGANESQSKENAGTSEATIKANRENILDHATPEGLMSLRAIEAEVNHLAGLIAAPEDILPTYGYSRDFAYPHIEVNESGYHYVIVERGQELKRETTTDIDQLLYWIFESVAFDLAHDDASKNRVEGQDSRRMAFAKQEAILGRLNPDWAERIRKKHSDILAEHPFDDLSGLRASFCRELRKKGLPESEITKMVYEKYPKSPKQSQAGNEEKV